MSTPCPCESGRPYADCCAPLHAGAPAPDAERLMRSRYSAFVLGRRDYLLASWHPDTRPAELPLEPARRWLGLSVRAHQPLGEDAAVVEFVARSRVGGGRAERLHERSRFRRLGGHWLYLDGELDPAGPAPAARRRP
ncbi:MAG TPA: YchJ family protein [Nevskiaceae bacterium]|nr:YchJ family protein [Nevskiaceae bacterium]